MTKLAKLEEHIARLEQELKNKKKEFLLITIDEWIRGKYNDYKEIITLNEMKVMCNFLQANFLFKLFDQGATIPEDYFYEKVCLMLDMSNNELINDFGDLIKYYEELEEYMTHTEIMDKINFFRDNIEEIEEDNLEVFFILHS